MRKRHFWLSGLILAAALWITSPFLTPIAWGILLAVAEWPLYDRAAGRYPRRSRLLAAAFALVTGLIVVLPLSTAAISLEGESEVALQWLQHAQQSGISMPSWLTALPLAGKPLGRWWSEHLSTPQGAQALLAGVDAGGVLRWAKTIGGAVARNAGSFLLVLLSLGTLLAQGRRIDRLVRRAAERIDGAAGLNFLERMVAAVRATVNGTLLVSVGEGLLIGVGYLVAGVPAPFLFTAVTIVLALIPFGAWAAFGLARLILVGEGATLAGVLLFAYGVVVMEVGDNVVQAAVVSRAIKLPFLMTILGAFGGLAVLGLIGLFIGPVIMAALMLVSQEWVRSIGSPGDRTGG